MQDAHCQFISELAGDIADEEDNDAEDKELELEPEAPPPPPPPVDDVDDEAYITVDADLAAADAADAVEAKDVAEDEAWRAAREALAAADGDAEDNIFLSSQIIRYPKSPVPTSNGKF